MTDTQELWPHQVKAIDGVDAAIGAGHRRIVVTIPTGGGKTVVAKRLALAFLNNSRPVVLYTNRTMLRDQISASMMDAGVYHGLRAAGEADEREHPFQISSIQTEYSRVVKKKTWDLHEADLVLVDEAHLQKGEMARVILGRHAEAGAVIVGLTATPLDLEGLYEHLVVAGTNAELRACGALIPAHHFAPDEPDLKAFKKAKADHKAAQAQDAGGLFFTEKAAVKAMGPRPQLFGRLWQCFEQMNLTRRPTLVFGPDVDGSLWIAEQFTKNGVRAAHIDGDDVWLDGEFHRSDRTIRERVVAESRAGLLPVVCNRFVMREGIDMPWLSHGIFATTFGSVQTYIQAGGRLLRAFPGLDHVTIADHGGNWWRYGSLNEDRTWSLSLSPEDVVLMRTDRIREGKKDQPFRCPKCGRTWTKGRTCVEAHGGCGYTLPASKRMSRPVVTVDGELKEMTGQIFRKRSYAKSGLARRDWIRLILYRCRQGTRGERTYRQALAAFAAEHRFQWPDPTWPLMPNVEMDRYLPVHEVPRERLTYFPTPEEIRGDEPTTAPADYAGEPDPFV